eukprot:scaffold15072_cov68-Phaeocystis_antarctica.AAC.13
MRRALPLLAPRVLRWLHGPHARSAAPLRVVLPLSHEAPLVPRPMAARLHSPAPPIARRRLRWWLAGGCPAGIAARGRSVPRPRPPSPAA